VLHDTPHRIAWGFALGIVVGWLPIVGIQMVTVALLAWALRGNVLASLPPVWISNPLTLVPMYYLMNRVGAVFVGNALERERVAEIVDTVSGMEWTDAASFLLTETLGAFGAMMVGGILLGIACALPCYFLVRRAAYTYQLLRDRRRAGWRSKREPPASERVEHDVSEPPGDQTGDTGSDESEERL